MKEGQDLKEKGFLVLASGNCFQGRWLGGSPRAGEVVFNTAHCGYEEIATDPSYYSQIMVMTQPMQGNYGASHSVWESSRLWINGLICLEMQNSPRESHWLHQLTYAQVPVVDHLDTRRLVLHLRDQGTQWGAMVPAVSVAQAQQKAKQLLLATSKGDQDWVYQVSTSEAFEQKGFNSSGPKVAVLDFGCKLNILRELQKRCSLVKVFPSRTSVEEIRHWNPDGILLSNGPGDPAEVKNAVDTVRSLLGWKFIFGICMGHQILGLALGGSTYKLKFGHRGANHPVRDNLLQRIYVTSQNHGYALDPRTLPASVTVTHWNLNDQTVSGLSCWEKKCMSVQFHPESHPGPHDAVGLFDYFIKQLI